MTPKKVPVEVFVQNAAAFASPAECLREIVLAYTEYKTVAEEERTKRRGIEAWEKATIAQIKAQRDFLIDYLNRSFDERSEVTNSWCILLATYRISAIASAGNLT